MTTLVGKVVIVTGASSGIGRETALTFAQAGSRVALAARRVERLEEVARAIEADRGEALVVPTDVSDRIQVERLVEATVSRWGRVDILVNNAGFGIIAPVERMAPEDVERIMAVNFLGAVYGTMAVLPYMRRQGSGHIINVASILGKWGSPDSAAYCASKHAMVGFSDSLRLELEGSGIFLSLICPAGTDTEFLSAAFKQGHMTPRAPRIRGPVQAATHVAEAIVRCARKPRYELFPLRVARLPAIARAFSPGFLFWVFGVLRRRAARKAHPP